MADLVLLLEGVELKLRFRPREGETGQYEGEEGEESPDEIQQRPATPVLPSGRPAAHQAGPAKEQLKQH
jgi:hypothetical protein